MANELNFQIPREGYDSYLYGIIPDDQAVLAGAFSVSMQQVRNIDKIDLKDFAKVAFSLESTVGLPLTAGTDIPTDTPLSTAAKIKTALGSGVYGTFTHSNFFGAMSGLPYPWENIYNNIKDLETQTLTSIYQNLYLIIKWDQAGTMSVSYTDDGLGNYTFTGVSYSPGGGYCRENSPVPTVTIAGATGNFIVGTDPNDLTTYGRIIGDTFTASGTTTSPTFSVAIPDPPGPNPFTSQATNDAYNAVIQTYIDNANDEIESITESSAANFEKSTALNTLWNITGIALKHEQRARYVAMAPVTVPHDDRLTSYPTALYVFVDGIPDFAKDTLPHMAAQTLEHISDLRSTGGQSIVAMMRQERNQERLADIGIELDNNLKSDLDDNLKQQLMTNGTLCGAVEGVESENGCIYTLPSWPENTKPYAFIDEEGLKEVEETTPGNIIRLILGDDPIPIMNPEVPIGDSPPITGVGGPIGISNTPFINEDGIVPNFDIPTALPPELNSVNTGTTLLPSTYNVPDAIDKVIECNCDCWVK